MLRQGHPSAASCRTSSHRQRALLQPVCSPYSARQINFVSRHQRPGRQLAAVRDAASFTATIREAEEAGDWLAAFEALTEASVTQTQLPAEAVEGGIRTLALGGQWQRSADLCEKMITASASGGQMPTPHTVQCVFVALANGKQATRAQAMLQVLKSQGAGQDILVPAHNSVVRVLARSGLVVEAYDLLEGLVTGKGGVRRQVVFSETFACVCNELLKSGDGDRAEEVLEWRDFLVDEE